MHNLFFNNLLFKNLFKYSGNETGTWYIDLKNGKGAIGKGKPNQPADAILTMDSKNFFAMFSGKKI